MKNTCSESPSCCFTVFLLIFVIIEKIKEAKGVALSLSPSAELTSQHHTPGVDPRLITELSCNM